MLDILDCCLDRLLNPNSSVGLVEQSSCMLEASTDVINKQYCGRCAHIVGIVVGLYVKNTIVSEIQVSVVLASKIRKRWVQNKI